MARMILKGFPPAPPGAGWCAVCAVLAKGALLAPQREQIEAGLDDGTRETFTVGVNTQKAFALLAVAVTTAMSPVLPYPAPLCWMHLPAIDGNAPPPEPEQQRPGLLAPGQPLPQRRRPA